jgi:hypothetical protein
MRSTKQQFISVFCSTNKSKIKDSDGSAWKLQQPRQEMEKRENDSLPLPNKDAAQLFSDVYVLYISTLSVSHIIQSSSQVNKRVYQY